MTDKFWSGFKPSSLNTTEGMDASDFEPDTTFVKLRIQARAERTRYLDALQFIEEHGLEKELEAWLIEQYSE